MKYILAIMCALVVLFMGGCAVMLVGFDMGTTTGLSALALIPAAIALLNLFILGGLFGWGIRWKPAFYILGVADLIIAAFSLLPMVISLSQFDYYGLYALPYAAVFALKGVLSIYYARNLPDPE